MPLTAAQIVTIATQTARAPGYVAQAGQLLNSILSDLCQTYDIPAARKTFTSVFNPVGAPANANYTNLQPGAGPYALPADFLRCIRDDQMWFLQGVPYPMIAVDLAEYDWYVQQAGNQSYPYVMATDLSASPPLFVVWPAASGAYPFQFRYQSQMPDIDTPETSAVVPWFPNQRYLMKQLSGMLMELTDDDRSQTFLGDGDPDNPGSQAILRKYLKEMNDPNTRAKRVTLDRRRFRNPTANLKITKATGW